MISHLAIAELPVELLTHYITVDILSGPKEPALLLNQQLTAIPQQFQDACVVPLGFP